MSRVTPELRANAPANSLFPVLGEEIAQPDDHGPDDRDERPGLRGVARPLGQERRNEDVGRGHEQEGRKVPRFPPGHFHQSQEREEIDGRVEEEPVLLVEEVSGQRLPAEAEGDAREKLLRVGERFPGLRGFPSRTRPTGNTSRRGPSERQNRRP